MQNVKDWLKWLPSGWRRPLLQGFSGSSSCLSFPGVLCEHFVFIFPTKFTFARGGLPAVCQPHSSGRAYLNTAYSVVWPSEETDPLRPLRGWFRKLWMTANCSNSKTWLQTKWNSAIKNNKKKTKYMEYNTPAWELRGVGAKSCWYQPLGKIASFNLYLRKCLNQNWRRVLESSFCCMVIFCNSPYCKTLNCGSIFLS